MQFDASAAPAMQSTLRNAALKVLGGVCAIAAQWNTCSLTTPMNAVSVSYSRWLVPRRLTLIEMCLKNARERRGASHKT